jgi:hypothetical protein
MSDDHGHKMTRDAYSALVESDLAWLRAQPRTLERDHVEMVLVDSVRTYYPPPAPSTPPVANPSGVAAGEMLALIRKAEAMWRPRFGLPRDLTDLLADFQLLLARADEPAAHPPEGGTPRTQLTPAEWDARDKTVAMGGTPAGPEDFGGTDYPDPKDVPPGPFAVTAPPPPGERRRPAIGDTVEVRSKLFRLMGQAAFSPWRRANVVEGDDGDGLIEVDGMNAGTYLPAATNDGEYGWRWPEAETKGAP